MSLFILTGFTSAIVLLTVSVPDLDLVPEKDREIESLVDRHYSTIFRHGGGVYLHLHIGIRKVRRVESLILAQIFHVA